MKTTVLLAGLLIFASPSHAQVREEMAPPPPVGVPSPDAEYCPPEDPSNGSGNLDAGCCTVAPIEVELSSGCSSEPDDGPAVVEGTNDGEYIPSTFMPYRRALHEGMQELAAKQGGSSAKTEPGAANPATSKSAKPVKPAAAPQSWPDSATITAETTPQDWPKPETVAEAAREN